MDLLMKKRLLIISFVSALLLSWPLGSKANDAEQTVQTEQAIDDDISISINGQWVTVSGAQGKTLEVVSLTGRRVMTLKIESPAQRVELNVPKGCYILKIGKVVRKVAIR